MNFLFGLRGRAYTSCGRAKRFRGETGRQSTRRSCNRGFTLIEVTVAAGLLLFATSGIVPFFVSGLGQASTIRYKSIATNIAREQMEEIRKLDYRDIESGDQLAELFGSTATQRDIAFDVTYAVEDSSYEDGSLKQVTVTVSWTGPPEPSPASVTTMIHQQYLGPRGALLQAIPNSPDPLGTPFPIIASTGTVRYHIAEVDWSLVFADLSSPATSATGAYARIAFVDDYEQAIQLGDEADEFKLDSSYLHWSTTDGEITDVWYQVSLSDLPFWDDADDAADGNGNLDGYYDGYWEVRACAFNEYDQPGNTWRIRLRVENGRPEAVSDFVAEPVIDGDLVSMNLYWLPGHERDRDHYVLQRQKWVLLDEATGTWGWSEWTTLSDDLPGTDFSYTDSGAISSEDDPWGTELAPNYYRYSLYPVDICDPDNGSKPGESVVIEAPVPTTTTTTTTLEGETTTTTTTTSTTTTSSTTTTTAPSSYSVVVENSTSYNYTITVKDHNSQTVFTGTLKKGDSLTISGLVADDYQLTATCSHKSTIIQSFNVPDQKSSIVLSVV